ncbi:N-methylhydantoinase A [Halalkaliarchaeum desulfuricum]|uniref:N-methylhydantoinase A n=1 Tax=Halalkaliarchaeum desulfuricum TaxID=2055893 RepID=A0A343TLR4_9EURY|nr:hydantoinase/oxoprolinase family protein [Halalkaliarchaeum desulfuricum]AUX10036.1 N-methylhydantoinase A [Halalkaliarchaeum desulfuricum]
MEQTATDVRIGVDVGGTFTDVVTVRDGSLHVAKTPSTPAAPDRGVLDGLDSSREDVGYAYGEVGFFAHGTTVTTNAVLERDWAETALLTTEGFRDAIEIGRQARPDIYDFDVTKPEPIVERDRRYEVPERLDERGRVERELTEAEVRKVAAEIHESDVESVAVSLLFAFENDTHERRVADILREEEAAATISCSSDVLPEIREYERTLATALNAALKPVMDAYVGRLEESIRERKIPSTLRIMQSNGGTIDADRARTRPVDTLLSGPAAGVQGAAHVAGLRNLEDVITMDMGGTSCDVSLVRGGDPVVSTELEVGDYPLRVPMIEIHTIGAGGGSIAWIDAGDALRVGPRSAGADPGPICYGRGGEEPTVTDAHLLLGRLDPDRFLSDELEADVDRVRGAVDEHVAEPLGLSTREAAQGILDVANANMERALRVVSVERGHDPRDFGLVAFGGAGPLHAASLAAELDVPRVIVPRTAGVLSALGLLVTDLLQDFSTSMVRRLPEADPSAIEAVLQEFEREGRERLSGAVPDDKIAIERSLDLRYVGQSFELTVPLPDGDLTADTLATVEEQFHETHGRRYGHASPEEPVELVTVRSRARGLIEPPEIAPSTAGGRVDDAIREERSVTFDSDPHETRIYDRSRFPPEAEFKGPAIVEGSESTVVVRPEQTATVDEYGTIILEVES